MLTPPAAILAILFASGEPIEMRDLAKLLDITESQLKLALGALHLDLKGKGLSLVESASEVELRTSTEAAPIIKKLRENELSRDLGKAGLETLAIIAYRAGATRSEIDWVRGVNSTTSIRTLLLRGLIAGEEDSADRRRIIYRITTEALGHLGIADIENLPRYKELSTQSNELPTSDEAPSSD